MTASTSTARHLLFRLGESSHLPDALLGALRDEVVLAGWLRASGVLHDVRLRALGTGAIRALSGAVQVVMLDGSIGLAHGDVTCGLRALLVRETETGLETIAGEIVEARVGALEVMVTALDDINATRQAGPAGVWLVDATGGGRAPAPAPAFAPPLVAVVPAPPPSAAPPAPAPVPTRVADPEPPKPAAPKPSPTYSGSAAMPPKPVRPAYVAETEEQIYPDAGDVVEHFAFGRCEVVKSDGDRLHLRLGKDGRIKEIALEMLKVTPLDPVEGQTGGRHFKLDRRL